MAFKYVSKNIDKVHIHILKQVKPRSVTFCGLTNPLVKVPTQTVGHLICDKCMEAVAAKLRRDNWKFWKIQEIIG